MKEEQLERFGEIIDSIENLIYATSLPMPAEFHLKHFKEGIREKWEELNELYNELKKEEEQ